MKFLLPLGLLLVLSGSCKKTSPDGELYGNWKLTKYTGLTGSVIQPPPNAVYILSLQGDHGFKMTLSGVGYEQGTYSISDITIGSEKLPAIRFKGQIGPDGITCCVDVVRVTSVDTTEVFKVNNDTLLIGTGAVNGSEYQYIKVR